MPMHDWTKVDAGIYHDFHGEWISRIKSALNRGLLPKDHYAISELYVAGMRPDVLTLQTTALSNESSNSGTATLSRPSTTFFVESSDLTPLRRKKHVAIRQARDDRVVAVVEILSPGNKSSRHALASFLNKAHDLLDQGIHLLVLDPFPPGPRDPQGVHAVLWERYDSDGAKWELPQEKPLQFTSYEAGEPLRAYLEPLAVGDELPTVPLFLAPEFHVMLPLEPTYLSAWDAVPLRWQRELI